MSMLCLEAWPILTRYMRVSFCEWIHKLAQTDVFWRVTRPLPKPKKRDGVPGHIRSHGVQVCDSFRLAYICVCVCLCVFVCLCVYVRVCVTASMYVCKASCSICGGLSVPGSNLLIKILTPFEDRKQNICYMLWKLKPF
jgi:hypothetical protein